MKKRTLLKLLSYWPPYLGAGIRVDSIDSHFRNIRVSMKLSKWNQNYVGTHFGGSLYSMCDPFFMLILIENLGKEYIVWDKAASIEFKRPGKGRVTAKFEITPSEIEKIKEQADNGPKVEPEFSVNITDDADQIIATVYKKLYVKRKPQSSNI